MLDPKNTSKSKQTRTHQAHPEPLNGLLNTVARFQVSRLNRGQPLFHRAATEYIDNNADDILENPDSDYEMWDCCCVQVVSYGKRNGQYAGIKNGACNIGKVTTLLTAVYDTIGLDLSDLAPCERPALSLFVRRGPTYVIGLAPISTCTESS